MATSILSSHWHSSVSALNHHEIVIFGGRIGPDALGDVVVLDTRTDTCRKATNGKSGGFLGFCKTRFDFIARVNLAAPASEDRVVALVQSEESDAHII